MKFQNAAILIAHFCEWMTLTHIHYMGNGCYIAKTTKRPQHEHFSAFLAASNDFVETILERHYQSSYQNEDDVVRTKTSSRTQGKTDFNRN